MNITAATVDDARAIAQVHVRSWPTAYAGILEADFLNGLSIDDRAQRWRDILQNAASQVLVARCDDGVVAFASFERRRDEGVAGHGEGEVWTLYVHPAFWGRGAGRALLAAAVRELRAQGCETVSLWVLSENLRGRGFYEACGFEPVPAGARLIELGGSRVEERRLRLTPGTRDVVADFPSTAPGC